MCFIFLLFFLSPPHSFQISASPRPTASSSASPLPPLPSSYGSLFGADGVGTELQSLSYDYSYYCYHFFFPFRWPEDRTINRTVNFDSSQLIEDCHASDGDDWLVEKPNSKVSKLAAPVDERWPTIGRNTPKYEILFLVSASASRSVGDDFNQSFTTFSVVAPLTSLGLPPPILLHRRVGDFFKRFHRLSSTIRRSTQLKLKESINIDLVIGTTFWRAQGIGNWIFVGNRFVDLSIWQLERPLQLTATANRPAMISTSGVG